MKLMTDLLGKTLSFHDLPAAERVSLLYQHGDRHPAGSAERAELYRLAADAGVGDKRRRPKPKTCHKRGGGDAPARLQ